jgi:hypothetical protein
MNLTPEAAAAARKIHDELGSRTSSSAKLKLKTLLGKFGYVKRSDSNTGAITTALADLGISMNPPIIRFGEDWEITTEDWIHLSLTTGVPLLRPGRPRSKLKEDPWFMEIAGRELRTEKEVEIKFIVPLLARLGYGDDDRFDGMPVPAAHGSKATTLEIDFALFDSTQEALRHQPLLVVEAKKEKLLKKRGEILKAHNQAKSYCLWTQSDFFMITDSRTVQLYYICRGNLADLDPLFSCERHELASRFGELHALASREVLAAHYLAKIGHEASSE